MTDTSAGAGVDGGMSLDEAAARYSASRAAERARDDQGRFAADDQSEQEDLEAAAFEGEEPQDDELLEADPDEDGEQHDDQDDQDGEDPQLVRVKINGEEKDVPLAEVVAKYQMGEDYTRKTQALAQERQQFAEVATRTAAERQAYTQLLGQVAQFLVAQAPSEDAIEQIMAQDPVEGWRAERLRKDILARANEFQQGYHQMVQGVLAEAQRDHQQALAKAAHVLPDLVPEWRDAQRYAREAPQIAQTMLAAGFSQAELGQINDPRAMVVARKAWLWDQLQAAKQQKLQPTKPTKPAPTLRPGGGGGHQRSAARANDLMARATQSGSIEDVAAAYRATRRK